MGRKRIGQSKWNARSRIAKKEKRLRRGEVKFRDTSRLLKRIMERREKEHEALKEKKELKMDKKIRKEFKLSYKLSSTEDHTIDAEVLGKSLTNMAGMLKEADKIVNGEESEIKVQVRAHEEGSFMVDMVTWLNEGGIDILRTLGITLTTGAVGTATFFQKVKAIRLATHPSNFISTVSILLAACSVL